MALDGTHHNHYVSIRHKKEEQIEKPTTPPASTSTRHPKNSTFAVVLDTNVLLGSLTTVEKLHEAFPELRFLIPYAVVLELDHKKNESGYELQKKARAAIRWLTTHLLSKKEGRVVVQQTDRVMILFII